MKFFGGYHVNEYRATGQLTRGNRSELALFRHHKSSDVNTALLLRLAFINKGSAQKFGRFHGFLRSHNLPLSENLHLCSFIQFAIFLAVHSESDGHITPKRVTLSQSSGFLGNQSKFTS